MKRTLRLLSLMAGLLLASSGAYAQEWKELVVNGDFEGSDFSSFSIYNTSEQSSQNLTTNDIVVDDNDANNHCAKLAFTTTPSKNQFIIKFTEPLIEGELFSFSLRAKTTSKSPNISAKELGTIKIQSGGEWSAFTYKGLVDTKLAGCQTITIRFMKNTKQTDIFYFDDISMKVQDSNNPIEFADSKVKEICVNKWDTNGDGELSVGEAASVTDLELVFSYNQEITSFNELQYFIGLTSIKKRDFQGCGNLTSIIIPENVTEISTDSSWGGAFSWSYNLKSVTFLGNKIEKIGDYAFQGCNALTSINIPQSVTSIGYDAFYNCYSLPTLFIPKSVSFISDYAFDSCSGLTSIVVEQGNKHYDSRGNCNALIYTSSNTLMLGSANTVIPSTVTTIYDRAFYNCNGLTSLTIPNSVTSIGGDAFRYCSGLTSIVVEDGNSTYDSRNNCNALIATATDSLITGSNNTIIPNNIRVIGPNAFYECAGLKSITIPKSVQSIGASAFYGCAGPNLLEIIVEEGNPTYDSRNNCNALIETATDSLILGCKNTTILDGVKAIGGGAFYRCPDLTSIILPNSIKIIEGGAFLACTNLTSIVLGNGLEIIGSFAFLGCDNLTNVYCYAEKVPDAHGMYGNIALKFDISKATLHVPAASIQAYSEDDMWKDFGSIIALTDSDPKPTGITNINNNSMTGKRYYSIDGKQISRPQHGMNIIRMKDGTTRKVIVK